MPALLAANLSYKTGEADQKWQRIPSDEGRSWPKNGGGSLPTAKLAIKTVSEASY